MEGLTQLITICVSKSFGVNERTAIGATECVRTVTDIKKLGTLSQKFPLVTFSFHYTHFNLSLPLFYSLCSLFASFRGKFAVVKRCVEKATGKVFAAKFIKKRRRGRDCRAEVVHEIAVLESAKNNPRVVNLYAVYETDHDLVLMLE